MPVPVLNQVQVAQLQPVEVKTSVSSEVLKVLLNTGNPRKLEQVTVQKQDGSTENIFRISGDSHDVMLKILGNFRRTHDFNYLKVNSEGICSTFNFSNVTAVTNPKKVKNVFENQEVLKKHFVDLVIKACPTTVEEQNVLLSDNSNLIFQEFVKTFL